MTAYSGPDGRESNDRNLEESVALKNLKASLGRGSLIRVLFAMRGAQGWGTRV